LFFINPLQSKNIWSLRFEKVLSNGTNFVGNE